MSGSDLVTLRDGQAVPLPVLRRLWSLEERGVTFRLESEGFVEVGPSRLLDDDDRTFLRQHKLILVSILAVEVHA
jgi:hypothetical protein